jgi:hypothetical protein
LLLIQSSLISLSVLAQKEGIDSFRIFYPGPLNQDTSKYTNIYIMRSGDDPAPNWWQVLFIDDYPMAKIQYDNRYIIRCAKNGPTKLSCGDGTESIVELNIHSGDKIYLRMTMEKAKPNPIGKLFLLNPADGIRDFDTMNILPINIYDPDPMEWKFNRGIIESSTVHDPHKKVGFNEFIFDQPVTLRHYFASAEMGYMYTYANKMVSPSYSEAAFIQRMGDKDFNSQEEFENFVKSKVEQGDKKQIKKSESVSEFIWVEIPTAADMSYASYIVTHDTNPQGVGLKDGEYLEVRTWQAYMYKKEVKKNKGRIFQVSFTERGFPSEIHTKEEIFYKMNLLLKSITFGKVGE